MPFAKYQNGFSFTKILALGVLLLLCFALNFFTLKLFYSGVYTCAYYAHIILYAACIILLLPSVRKAPLVSIVLIGLLCSELFFSTRCRSANEPVDIASANFAWHYHPSFEKDTSTYRQLANDTVDIFNGDSFGFGSGLTDPSQTYSHLVAAQLHNNYCPVYLASPGSEMYGQYKKMCGFNKAHLIIHQCYVTDLCRPCDELGHPQPDFVFLKNYSGFLRKIVQCSATAQYLCYGSRTSVPDDIFNTYFHQCGEKPEVMARLCDYTDSIVQFAQQKKARLIFVLIPNASQPEQSLAYINYVKKHFDNASIEYVDTSPLLTATPFKQRVISDIDYHLNADIHKQIAELLLKKINATGAK